MRIITYICRCIAYCSKEMEKTLFDKKLTGDRIDYLANELCIIENPKVLQDDFSFPIRYQNSLSIIVLSGKMECIVDMTVHRIDIHGMLLTTHSQIVEKLWFSEDFKGYCMIMAPSFLSNMPMNHKTLLIEEVKRIGFYPLEMSALSALTNFVKMVQAELLQKDNRFQYECVTYLTIAWYYGIGAYIHSIEDAEKPLTRYGQISDRFLELVRKNCHIHRDMDFYSEALCLSAKHISLAVKKVTGENAMKWIERYTVLRAKSLLKTSELSVSEIAYSLNFPTSSDFGKYFKKFTGYSPKAFRDIL